MGKGGGVTHWRIENLREIGYEQVRDLLCDGEVHLAGVSITVVHDHMMNLALDTDICTEAGEGGAGPVRMTIREMREAARTFYGVRCKCG